MTNRHAEFAAKHLRQPTPDEERQLAEQERQDRREADAQRRERELRHAYLDTPGATPESWEKEKAGILTKDREEQAIKNKDAARQAQSQLYRSF
jgi:hypothetical protein